MNHVAVSGASRGIGRATAIAFARRNFRVTLIGRSSPAHDETASLIRDIAGEVRLLECDLESRPAVLGITADLVDDPPDVIVHNAATIERAAVPELSDDSWDRQMQVNLHAPFALTRGVLPAMLQRGSGRHLFVGSISATLGTANQSAYNASKWALLGFVKCLAEELTDTGQMAACVLPGSVDTQMLAGSGFAPRMTPADVAATIVYLGTDAPLAHNGAAIELYGV